jgi:hypothetical protein
MTMRMKFILLVVGIGAVAVAIAYAANNPRVFTVQNSGTTTSTGASVSSTTPAVLDTVAYDTKLLAIANIPLKQVKIPRATSTIGTTSTISVASSTRMIPDPYLSSLWPVKTTYPNVGALLPFNRIVAYYGNFYSKQMGILGQYPPDQVLAMLASTTKMWSDADPTTPVIPAFDYIVVTAQASAGRDGKYRLRMPDSEVNKVLAMAEKVHGIVFLDVQVALSSVQVEVPLLEKYLKMPQVHLSLDPEFDMPGNQRPGTVIGTMSAADINFAANYLAGLVKQYNLPPKLLVIHRFTNAMVTDYKTITPLPEVQVVMDMDGFGFPAKKINTYQRVIVPEPVQFTGFKLFYHNDSLGNLGHVMLPAEVLKLSPQPSYIQYQ